MKSGGSPSKTYGTLPQIPLWRADAELRPDARVASDGARSRSGRASCGAENARGEIPAKQLVLCSRQRDSREIYLRRVGCFPCARLDRASRWDAELRAGRG